MSRRESLMVEHDGEQIGVEVAGAGPAVVLLHGSGGNRATWWQQVVDLARDFTVVTVEARGAGPLAREVGEANRHGCSGGHWSGAVNGTRRAAAPNTVVFARFRRWPLARRGRLSSVMA